MVKLLFIRNQKPFVSLLFQELSYHLYLYSILIYSLYCLIIKIEILVKISILQFFHLESYCSFQIILIFIEISSYLVCFLNLILYHSINYVILKISSFIQHSYSIIHPLYLIYKSSYHLLQFYQWILIRHIHVSYHKPNSLSKFYIYSIEIFLFHDAFSFDINQYNYYHQAK